MVIVIVLTVKNLRANLKGKLFTLLKIFNFCQLYSHPESESLHIYGLISV